MSSASQASTIYLTSGETDRIEQNVKARLQQCQHQAGQPHVSQTTQELRRQVIGASLMADIAGDTLGGSDSSASVSESIPVLTVGQVYPPCTLPLADLTTISLPELRLETHHRGRVLHVRRSLPVVTLRSRSWTVIEDVLSGESERLEVCLHKARHGDELLKSTTEFRLKDPYLTLNDQGEPTFRVDHPSDLVAVEESEGIRGAGEILTRADSVNDGGDGAQADLEEEAASWKEKGNVSLKERAFTVAHANYTRGIGILSKTARFRESKLYHDLHRNRAHVNLLLSRFEQAKDDALASIGPVAGPGQEKFNAKAYFRASSAACRLECYGAAIEFIEKELRLDPDDKGAKFRLKAAERRVQEAATGNHDLPTLRAGLSKHRPRVDAASWSQHVEINQSPGKGRGLFTKRSFKPGDLVMLEKAYCVVWAHERNDSWISMTYDVRDDKMRVSPSGLCAAVVQKMRNNPRQASKVLELYSDYTGLGKEFLILDSEAVVDTFQVHDIVSRNAFGPGEQYGAPPDALHASTGLWIKAAYTNHSCAPNVEKEFVGDLLLLRATRSIRAGEELLHSYIAGGTRSARRKALKTTWGFECNCVLCGRKLENSTALHS